MWELVLTKFIQSAYFSIPCRSNQRIYQYDEGAVKVRPKSLPDSLNLPRRSFIRVT